MVDEKIKRKLKPLDDAKPVKSAKGNFIKRFEGRADARLQAKALAEEKANKRPAKA